ncbi:MAG: universal stress protein [Acidimicrobiales bacterium]
MSKLIGSMAGAKLARLSDREGMALGVGLNARGALEIVIATVGLRLDVLNSRSFTVIVLMAMATSMAAPPLLRLVLRNFDGSPSERRRLDQEHQLAANKLVGGGRILLPTRGGVASLLAAQVAGLVWPTGSVSLLTIGSEGRPGASPVRDVLGNLEVLDITSMSESAAQAIVDEAALGYEAIVIGCSGARTDGLFSPLVDAVLSTSPVPVLVVRMPRLGDGTLPWAFGSALVPVSARDSSLAGQEVAAYLSSAIGTQLHHLYVSTGPTSALVPIFGDYGARTASTRQVLDGAARLATRVGANFASDVVYAENPARQILMTAHELAVDLVVVSGIVRHSGDHLFPGQTIERIVNETNTALIVALTPERPA